MFIFTTIMPVKKAGLLLYALLSLLFANAQSRQATFYSGRFTLTSKDDKFYFIDANDIEEVIKLGQWEKAELFESTGFVKTKKQENDGNQPTHHPASGNRAVGAIVVVGFIRKPTDYPASPNRTIEWTA